MEKEIKDKAVHKNVASWIVSAAARGKWPVVFLTLVQTGLSLFGVYQALTLKNLIDGAADKDRQAFLHYAVVLVLVVAAQLALRALSRFLREYSNAALENNFKKNLFASLMKRDYAQVTAVHSEEWMNRLTSDTVVVSKGITEIVPEVVGLAVKLLSALTAVLVLLHGFSWYFLLVGLLLAGSTYLFRNRLKILHKRIQESDGRLRIYLSERLSNLLVVRSFGKEEQSVREAEDLMKIHQKARMKRNHFSNFCNVGFGIVIQGMFAAAAIYCGYGILAGTFSYGAFAAVIQLVGQVQTPFASLSGYLPRYYAVLASAERLKEAEDFLPDGTAQKKDENEIAAYYREHFTGMGLRQASFTYTAADREKNGSSGLVVIRDVNLFIKKNDLVGITGPSGSGKSTILKLLMSLYPLDSGDRYLLGKEGEQALSAEWRGLFAYVPQGNQLMSGTIRSVVAMGDDSVTEEQINRAMTIACCDFIKDLPRGWETVLGERGSGLSEGQIQRLAIARAVLSDHPILLLDEATSSLDEKTERILLENLQQMTDKTVLIVTHRPEVLTICTREVRLSAEGINVVELKQE